MAAGQSSSAAWQSQATSSKNPQLRFTQAGTPVANFRIASTPCYQDSDGQWKDGDTTFITCVPWRKLAEHIAESLTRGARVMVAGRLTQRDYWLIEGGEKHTVHEIQVTDVGPSLLRATAHVIKAAAAADPGR